MSASPLTYGPYANTIKNEKQKERTNSQQVVPIIFCYMFLQPHEDSVQNILTCETVSFTASFPEWSSSGFRRRNNQTFRAKSMFSFQGSLRLIVDPNSSPRGKKVSSESRGKTVKTDFLVSARGLQSPYFGHFESCHRCGVSETSSSCLPFVRPVGFHPMKEKSPAAERGGCCAVWICPWAREQWGWGKGGGGCWATEDYCAIGVPWRSQA